MEIRKHTLFSTLHPALLLAYALGMPVIAMLSKEPVCLGIAFAGSAVMHCFFMGGRSLRSQLMILLPFLFVIGVFNMITNPGGMTVLFKVGGRLFTLESLLYGLASGAMLGGVILWFGCFTTIVPNDKFLYLFGRKFQGTALLLSMILKLFPDTRYKIRCIKMAQGGGKEEKGSLYLRLKHGMNQMSALLEWSMEDGIETADSMKARAYGEGKRTSYEHYRFGRYDIAAAALMAILFAVSAAAAIVQNGRFFYYPAIHILPMPGLLRAGADAAYMLLLLMPVWMEVPKKGGKSR